MDWGRSLTKSISKGSDHHKAATGRHLGHKHMDGGPSLMPAAPRDLVTFCQDPPPESLSKADAKRCLSAPDKRMTNVSQQGL